MKDFEADARGAVSNFEKAFFKAGNAIFPSLKCVFSKLENVFSSSEKVFSGSEKIFSGFEKKPESRKLEEFDVLDRFFRA